MPNPQGPASYTKTSALPAASSLRTSPHTPPTSPPPPAPAQQPIDADPAGARFVHENQRLAGGFELAYQPRHCRQLPAHRPVVAHLASALIAGGDIDRILVHVHS